MQELDMHYFAYAWATKDSKWVKSDFQDLLSWKFLFLEISSFLESDHIFGY
jgi:hypothetical protein